MSDLHDKNGHAIDKDGKLIFDPECQGCDAPTPSQESGKKILFLDIDGVVNCEKTFQRHRGVIGIDPYMAFLVGKIKLDTGCQVVLSSSWRHGKEGVKEVEKQVCELLDKTPNSDNGFRGGEVKDWLTAHPEVTCYAILDDDSDFFPDQPHFKTSWKEGLTKEIAKKVTEYLNAQPN